MTTRVLSPWLTSLDGFAAMDGLSAEISDLRVERFREYLSLLAHAHLPPRHFSKIDASDVVQQTLLKAHEQRGQFRGRSEVEFAAWLRQMLVNQLADALRWGTRDKRDVRRERSLEAKIEDSFSRADDWLAANDTSPSQQAMKIEHLLRLTDAIAQLPDGQREAIVMHHLQGLPLAELAVAMQRSEPSAAGLLRRGLKALRELMTEDL